MQGYRMGKKQAQPRKNHHQKKHLKIPADTDDVSVKVRRDRKD